MKFVGQVMDGVMGVEWYSIVGILIFLFLFIVILVRTFSMKKHDIDAYKNAILDDDEKSDNTEN